MRHSSNRQRVIQLALFHPTRSSPTWEQLPPEIRQQAVRLLGRLLRERMAAIHADRWVAPTARNRPISDNRREEPVDE